MATPARTLALFISDLHLQESHPRTAEAFFRFLDEHAARTRQLYLLGDIFEYWAGDDDLDTPFHARVVNALRALGDSGVELFWMAGNRDFLVGQGFAGAAGLTLLAEPHVVTIGGQRIALVHGDAECTLDTKYMEFRAMVRSDAWQRQFLSMPLEKRKAIIAGLREGSREAHTTKSYEIMDVTPDAIEAVFDATVENEAKNGLKNDKYTIAMARTSAPHSASAQFFINTKDNAFLNYPGQDGWGYAVFGKVTEGQDIVDQINGVKTTRSGMHSDVPVDPVIIEKVEVI